MARVVPAGELREILGRHPQVLEGCFEVAQELARESQAVMVREAYDTGRLAASVHAVQTATGAKVVAGADHAAPVEGGTGVYGPNRRKIYARAGHPFTFTTRLAPGNRGAVQPLAGSLGGVERTLRLTSHRGMPGRHIMRDTAEVFAEARPAVHFRRRRSWLVV